ncbi:ABC transporter substrate-binding protein [Solidesulfovibrio fructosivorans]|uniref:ABC transporter substrate-binding protein n=1 Tax=Solidesulfovibrio fructosivorans TaxID=878 RepID=UPI0002F34570|nr:ABC transporter substrate-binding protein [Solidesulfovibrio fructosivorans]
MTPAPPPKPVAQNTVAVLLPLGGPFRELGGKVQKGIKAAQDELAAAGTPLDVIVIDATQPDWVNTLRNLPPEVGVVGGPMHPLTLKELQSTGMLQSRVFLAFLSNLGEAREGIDAWRFFPSAADEIDALLRLSLSNYGITQFGILRPGDRYGQSMSEAFALAAAQLGGQITATGVYSPQDATGWDATVLEMLKTGGGRPGFGAVFIPDDWSRADKVLANFFRNKVDDLLILGPQLWTEALYRAAANKTPININNYRLAVCPGAWWPESQGKATQNLIAAMRAAGDEHPDMWEALGYDFARFAARLGRLPQGTPPQEVSARLAQAATGMEFSMAPLSYGPDGRAHVAMYLFRPSVAGPVLLDPEGFRQRLNAIRQKALENPAPETEQSYSPNPAPAAQPETQPYAPAPAQPQPAAPTTPQPGQQQQPAPLVPVPAHQQVMSVS